MTAALHEVLDVEFPIIQAPMAGVQDSALALAVCNTGGIGSLPGALATPEQLRRELESLRNGTAKPFNVNFFCHAPPPIDAGREAAWRALLEPYYVELGLDPKQTVTAPLRAPFSEDVARLIEPFEPRIVSFHFGLPEASLVARVRRWGAQVWSTATTVEEAIWLAARGVDAVIAQGVEAGGHRGTFLREDDRGELPTLELVRRVASAVSIPVIAAGGIADGADVETALSAGASAVQAGSAYLACPEAKTSAVHRAALESLAVRETAVTNLFTGRRARGLVNRLMRELGPVRSDVPAFPRAAEALAPLRAAAERAGSGDFSPLWAGANPNAPQRTPAAARTRELCEPFSVARRQH